MKSIVIDTQYIKIPIKLQRNFYIATLNMFYDLFFRQIVDNVGVDIVNTKLIKNENNIDYLNKLLLSKEIFYFDNAFVGYNNSKIYKILTNLGAVKYFDKYYINFDALPFATQLLIKQLELTNKENIEYVQKYFNKIELNNLTDVYNTTYYAKFLDLSLSSLEKQTNILFAKKGIQPEMTLNLIKQLKAKYIQNFDITIKNFTNNRLQLMRSQIAEMVLGGARGDILTNFLQQNFNVCKSKAKIYAKEESRLVTSVYQFERQKENGAEYFIWDGTGDSKMRPTCKEYDKKKFAYNNLPFDSNGNRTFPGWQPNCRCHSRAIWNLDLI